jgi:hypothetical protein
MTLDIIPECQSKVDKSSPRPRYHNSQDVRHPLHFPLLPTSPYFRDPLPTCIIAYFLTYMARELQCISRKLDMQAVCTANKAAHTLCMGSTLISADLTHGVLERVCVQVCWWGGIDVDKRQAGRGRTLLPHCGCCAHTVGAPAVLEEAHLQHASDVCEYAVASLTSTFDYWFGCCSNLRYRLVAAPCLDYC